MVNAKRPDSGSETEVAQEPLLIARMVGILAVGAAVAIAVFWGAGEWLDGPWTRRGFDRTGVEALGDLRNGALNRFMTLATYLGGGVVLAFLMTVAAILSFLLTRSVRWPLFFASAVLGIQGMVRVVKSLVGRVRPDFAPLGEIDTPAFPSGHAAASAACYGAIVYFLLSHFSRRWALLGSLACALVVILVGITRVYMSVHWPSDVVGGWALGGAWAALVVVATSHFAEKEGTE